MAWSSGKREDNPSISFSGGTKEILTINSTSFVNAPSTIEATWKLTGPRSVCLDVTGEGSAQIRIDMELDDDPSVQKLACRRLK